MAGKFITFEGIEGCGKSTQIALFKDFLESSGEKVMITREPGGTKIGDQIRDVLLNPKNISIFPMTELLLYAAGRAQHVEEKINPALNEGRTVLCDRYFDATAAYQGAARALPKELLKDLHKIATGNLVPKITFLLDLDPEVGLKRARSRNKEIGHEDRFENEAIAFHKKVREGYLILAKSEPERFIIIDASGTVDETCQRILDSYGKR